MKRKRILGLALVMTCLAIGLSTNLIVLRRPCVQAPSAFQSTPVIPPLQEAARKGNLEQVRTLIASGADVNTTDKGGRTALHMAARWGHLDIVELLVDRGADVNAKTTLGYNEQGGRVSIRKIPSGWTPLQAAMDGDNKNVMRLLIASGAKASIWQAVHAGALDTVKSLVADGANVNARGTDSNDTVLHQAVRNGHADIVEFLLASGVDSNAKGQHGQTALHEAAVYDERDAAQCLLDHGADVNAKDQRASTPLHEAAFYGQTSVAELLIAHGADSQSRTARGKTPLDHAHETGFADMVAVLGGDPNDPTLADNGFYTIVITDPEELRRFLRRSPWADFDNTWTPTQADIHVFDDTLKDTLQENRTIKIKTRLWRDYVLAHLRRYNREYAGFIKDGNRCIACQMIGLGNAPSRRPSTCRFRQVVDGGPGVVKTIFNTETQTVVEISCNTAP